MISAICYCRQGPYPIEVLYIIRGQRLYIEGHNQKSTLGDGIRCVNGDWGIRAHNQKPDSR